MARLRAPGGCPWDREQSFDSIRKYTLEEAYEVFDAIERRDFPHLAEELGDLLLQVLFYAEMAANEGHFTIADVLDSLNRKLVRRHPHVFGDEAARAAGNRADVDANVEGSADAVLRNWEEIKAAEALHAAAALRRRESREVETGFGTCAPCRRWLKPPSSAPRRRNPASTGRPGANCCPKSPKRPRSSKPKPLPPIPRASRQSKPSWAICCLPSSTSAAISGVDAEMALRNCNLRFRQRFREMELAAPRPLEDLSPNELEALWAAGQEEARSRRGGI